MKLTIRILHFIKRRFILITLQVIFKFVYMGINKSKKILAYTDSRGFLITPHFYNRTPFGSYIQKLSQKYTVHYKICPEKHTTIIDALVYLRKKNINDYDYIILHVGIVDFSPRQIDIKDALVIKKKKVWSKLSEVSTIPVSLYDTEYEGKQTFSLYSEKFLIENLLTKIKDISLITPIIWVGINEIDIKWRGNYQKDRPENINKVLDFQKKILDNLCQSKHHINYILPDKIYGFNIYEHTFDNIHLNREGFELLTKEIENYIN